MTVCIGHTRVLCQLSIVQLKAVDVVR